MLCENLPHVVEHKYRPPLEPEDAEGEVLKFRLIYRGPLASGSGKAHLDQKSALRRVFHEQLAELWQQHAGLRALSDPAKRFRHKKEANFRLPNTEGDTYNFLYLIGDGRRTIVLTGHSVFENRDSPGGLVKQSGDDLDNRLKILLDALRMPRENSHVAKGPPKPDEDPYFCLLQDDYLIEKMKITADDC